MTITVKNPGFSLPGKKVDGSPRPSLAPIRVESSESDSGLKKIPVELLEIDECNIRTSVNPKYSDIKKSIASDNGSRTVFHVTKNSEDNGYKVVFGTGTRLSVLKELASEFDGSGENPFANAHCIVVTDKGKESRTLASINENYARGDNSYIEWSQAIMALRGIVESEYSGKLTDADFCKHVGEKGLSLSKTELVRCRFASGQLMQSVPVAMTKARKSTVFVRKIMEGRSSSVGHAMKELGKSRDSMNPSYDNALMKVGLKLDGMNVDQEELLKKTERAFYKENDISFKPALPVATTNDMDRTDNGTDSSLAESSGQNAAKDSPGVDRTSPALSREEVLQYLVSLDDERFNSLLSQARSERS